MYKCKKCGMESIQWMGKCSRCQSWGSMEEVEATQKSTGKRLEKKKGQVESLKDVEIDLSQRLDTGIEELNRVLGSGLVKDSCTILTARPGAGKSTLLLEIAGKMAKNKKKVLYISGEESSSQIKARANRILEDIPDKIWILSTTSMDSALEEIDDIDPDIIFLDSIQVMTLEEYSSRAGSPVQTVECTSKFIEKCKGRRPRAGILVGHMTKADEMAGLRTLEHMVDTVLLLEGEPDEALRILVSTKNRFGQTGEVGLFEMSEIGLKEMLNPNEYFITNRKDPVPGSALGMIREGSRLLVIEIESLVSQSFTPYPQRIGDSLRKDQLNTLVSILEQRAGINLYDKNVILKTTGGMKVSEQSVNLAIIMSIVSSVKNKGIPGNNIFIAEVGLTGELKKVPRIVQRLKELDRLGYEKVYTYPLDEEVKLENLQVIECTHIQDVIKEVW